MSQISIFSFLSFSSRHLLFWFFVNISLPILSLPPRRSVLGFVQVSLNPPFFPFFSPVVNCQRCRICNPFQSRLRFFSCSLLSIDIVTFSGARSRLEAFIHLKFSSDIGSFNSNKCLRLKGCHVPKHSNFDFWQFFLKN